jgi:hypothetical protein
MFPTPPPPPSAWKPWRVRSLNIHKHQMEGATDGCLIYSKGHKQKAAT